MTLLKGNADEATVARTRGIVGGAAILAAFGTAWCLTALFNWAARPGWALPMAFAVAACLLGLCAVRLIVSSRIVSRDDLAAATAGKRTGIRFGIIFTIEGLLIAFCAVLLARHGLARWIPIIAAIIVGIHFLPLARVFSMPLYYGTGVLCVLGVLACQPIADFALRLLCVGLVMAAVLWLTSCVLLWQTRS